jgi:hypothetical protein
MKIYHSTSPANADSIEANGFCDTLSTYLTDSEHNGVWVSDRPYDGTEFRSDDEVAIFEIEADENAISPYEFVEEGKPYREWLMPAELLNTFLRQRFSPSQWLALVPDDVLAEP